jgi:hypothetical protein
MDIFMRITIAMQAKKGVFERLKDPNDFYRCAALLGCITDVEKRWMERLAENINGQ